MLLELLPDGMGISRFNAGSSAFSHALTFFNLLVLVTTVNLVWCV